MDTKVRARLESLRQEGAEASRASGLSSRLAGLPEGARAFITALVEGPCPDEALARALGLPEAVLQDVREPPVALAQLLHQGSYPARLLALCPDALHVLAPPNGLSPSKATLQADMVALAQTHGWASALGRVRTREYLRLCRAEMEGASLERVGEALCDLAEACIEVSLGAHDLTEDVAVFGMGKLGGRELNFLSDIDLVFVHRDEVSDGDAGRQRTVRLHERLRKVVRLLEGEGAFRPVFRVDLRLRPFGARGALSLSLSATEAYYERHGRAWERQVWLRARHVAGNAALAATLRSRLLPFVYRRSVTPAIFDEIAELMDRARRPNTGADRGVDLKLDEGGIRTVEFSVQALQLLHGGRDPSLRAENTMRALDALFAAGLLSDREHRELGQAYRVLRRIEHRLQLTDGAHTHSLPLSDEALCVLARRLSAPQGPYPLDASSFIAEVGLARSVASAVASSIAPPLAKGEPDPRAADRELALDLGAPNDERQAALGRLGVRDPQEADALLQHLASRADGAINSRSEAGVGARALLEACLDSADPDGALARMVEFARARPAHYGVWRFLSEPGPAGRDVVRLTAELLGTSAQLSVGLIGLAQAGGAQDDDDSIALLMGAGIAKLPTATSLAADAANVRPDVRGFDVTLRKFKETQFVATALFDLGQQPDALEVGRSLSDLADFCVRQVLREVAAEAARERPAAHGLRLAVFALGKYGMQAMDYGSDLDLIFVYDGNVSNREAIRVGQRLLARLSERHCGVRLYEVDMRLRPSGRQGLLVSPRAGFSRYHAKPLPVWESLALLRLRPVGEVDVEPELQGPLRDPEAGGSRNAAAIPGALSRSVEATVNGSLRRPHDALEVGRAVRTLKTRIEQEIARERRESGLRNAKSGRGASLELELLIAALCLLTPGDRPPRGVPAQIEYLRTQGALSAATAADLEAAYRFQRRFLNRLRMNPPSAGIDADRFAQNSPRLITLARRMGLASRTDLLAQFEATTQVVRSAFDALLEG